MADEIDDNVKVQREYALFKSKKQTKKDLKNKALVEL